MIEINVKFLNKSFKHVQKYLPEMVDRQTLFVRFFLDHNLFLCGIVVLQ